MADIGALTPESCAEYARELFDKRTGRSNKTNKALDKEIQESLIGTTYDVCSELWNLIMPWQDDHLQGAKPCHLFWALLFLFSYCTEPILTRVVGGADAKTYRTWSWKFIIAIAKLKPKVIVWKNRFRKWDQKSVCLVSVDCTDTPILEPSPFDPQNFSEKYNGPAYKYEVAVCIATADIVWINGPFKAGRSDITIFKEDGLKNALADEECVEVDGIGTGDDKYKNPSVGQSRKDRQSKSKVRARHENVNAWLKRFSVLDNVFRHLATKDYSIEERHQLCFYSVAVITQLRFELGDKLFPVEYSARYD